MVSRRFLILALLLALTGLTALAVDFRLRMEPNPPSDAFPVHAVVFSGQFVGVRAGLALLASGEIQQLLICGADSNYANRFATQFSLRGLRAAQSQGRLVLGEHADTTLRNAQETRCWLRDIHQEGPILLITAPTSMPRASIALEHALPGTEVRRLSVDEGEGQRLGGAALNEFAKYGATRAYLLTQSFLEMAGLQPLATDRVPDCRVAQ